MQFISKQRLTKVALALIVAGYCAAPAVAANGNLKSGQWQIVSESTGTIQGRCRGSPVMRKIRQKPIKTTLR